MYVYRGVPLGRANRARAFYNTYLNTEKTHKESNYPTDVICKKLEEIVKKPRHQEERKPIECNAVLFPTFIFLHQLGVCVVSCLLLNFLTCFFFKAAYEDKNKKLKVSLT